MFKFNRCKCSNPTGILYFQAYQVGFIRKQRNSWSYGKCERAEWCCRNRPYIHLIKSTVPPLLGQIHPIKDFQSEKLSEWEKRWLFTTGRLPNCCPLQLANKERWYFLFVTVILWIKSNVRRKEYICLYLYITVYHWRDSGAYSAAKKHEFNDKTRREVAYSRLAFL